MEVFGLGIKIKEEGAATVEASIKRLGAELAKTALTVGGLGTALNKLITSTTEAQFASAQLESTLQTTAFASAVTSDALTEQATALQRITIYGDDAIIRMQSLLLMFNNVRGEILTRSIPAILDLATRLQIDLSSAAMMVGKALQDPATGLMALNRSTKIFSESEKKMIEGLVNSGKTLEAQTIILQRLEERFQGAAEAARGTLGGALAALNEAFGDLFELSQESTSGAVRGIEALTKALVTLNDNFEDVKAAAIALSGVLLAMFSSRLLGMVGFTGLAFRNLAAGILSAFMVAGPFGGALIILQGLMAKAMLAARTMWTAIGGPLGLAIIGITTGFALWNRQMEKAKRLQEEVADNARRHGEVVASAMATFFAPPPTPDSDKAIEAQRKRIANLIEYNTLLPRQQRDLNILAGIERQLDAELRQSNTSLERKVELLRQLGQVRGILYEVDSFASKLTRTFTILGQTFRFAPVLDAASVKKQLEEYSKALKEAPSVSPRTLTLPAVFDPATSIARMRLGFQEYGLAVQEEAARLKTSVGDVLMRDLGVGLATALENGLAQGLEAAIMSGRISDLWKVLSQSFVSQIANMMVKVALTYIGFAKMIAAIQRFLIANPLAAVAAAAAMLAFAYANGGQGQSGTPTFAGGAGGLMTGVSAPGTLPTQQIIFGATSRTNAAGMPFRAGQIVELGPISSKAIDSLTEVYKQPSIVELGTASSNLLTGIAAASSQALVTVTDMVAITTAGVKTTTLLAESAMRDMNLGPNFTATSADLARTIEPRNPTNVTIIGPNDPSAQRAMQELMTKADSRGRLG